jgi:hypothetical protein
MRVQTKDGLDPTPAEDERLERILSDHIAEYCQCGHKLGWGDIAWNTATTEGGTDYSTIQIQCVVCDEEITYLATWSIDINTVEYLLDEIELNWTTE